MVYSRAVEGDIYTFGVSGRLYKSNVLLYDHQTDSLWSQLLEKAVSGPLVGKKLRKLPSSRTSWKAWRQRHPETLVLSTDTGYHRDYSKDPYTGYYRVGTIWSPVGHMRQDLSPRARILGIEVSRETRAYPLIQLQRQPGITDDSVGGELVHIEVSPEGEVVAVKNGQGEHIPHIFAYWFAWQAFHPETTVYRRTK
ncbi:MAG: DUF3179 domain-containing protein [Deltaproteobacteria bacterium]|nr:MAG: DUF3179 domain-containing protein [Deltaproteobacteria bacterium]